MGPEDGSRLIGTLIGLAIWGFLIYYAVKGIRALIKALRRKSE